MDDRVKEFLDCWQSEHVGPVPDADKQTAAEFLAKSCQADAERAGISEQALERAVGEHGPLPRSPT
jgi:hypothetical protein